MEQILFIQTKFYDSIIKHEDIIKNKGYNSADDFLNAIINKLNHEYDFLKIKKFQQCSNKSKDSPYGQYGAFVDGDNLQYKKVVIFFTPISSKIGNVIIEECFMPTICKQMEQDINFLLDNKYKKIAILTSEINKTNTVSTAYNKMQMDVNSLNTLNIDVIPFFPIKNLSTDTRFNSLDEYLDMSKYLQKKSQSNSQYEYLNIKYNILYGQCELSQIKGQFIKSFCFRFLTAIFSGKNNYKYDINEITQVVGKLDNQFANLQRFIEHINNNVVFIDTEELISIDNDSVIDYGEIEPANIDNIYRKPEKASDITGRKRFKVQKKIRDIVLKEAQYLCNCHNNKHFYFESINNHNYVEGHHLIPMNRQEEYYINKKINLDNKYNIVSLCPNCHCQIHFGSRKAKLKIISELFIRNKENLKIINPDITIELLASYYNIGLDNDEIELYLKI